MLTKQKNLKALLGTAAFALLFGSASVYAAGNAGGTSGASGASGASGSAATSGTQTSGGSASDSKSSVGKMSQADEKLMKELAATNIAEMKAAQIALDKSKDEQVQKFAQKMLDDHTKAHDKVRDLAQTKNVNLPGELDGKHQKEIKKMSDLSGDKFDKMYLKQGGVSDHKEALQLLERIEKKAKDPQLKAMATDLKPTIREHHQLATNMVKGNAATTTSGSSGGGSGSSSGSSAGGASSTSEKKAGSAGLTGRPPANNVELGNQSGSGSSGSSSGGSSGSSASSAGSKDDNGKVVGPTKANDVGVMDSPNSKAIRKGSESSSGSSTQSK